MGKKSEVGEVWDKKWEKLNVNEFRKNALAYDPWTILHQPVIDKYAQKIGRDGIFLEAGCGMGYWCFYIAEKYKIKTLGVDVAEEIISKLQKIKTEMTEFAVDDLNNSRLESDSADMFISLGVIEHFKNSNPMVNNLYRLLKSGGIGLITVPNVYSMHTITRPIAQLLGKWDIGLEKSFSPKKLKKLCQKNNFKIVECGVLPTGEMFGLFLNRLPILGKFFERISFFIEKRQNTFGFVAYVIVTKK
ncbi:MAG: class I SAM-dependent methyltransferase [Parcubacteria group bacterium]|jgi:SAM-dependent methyltransferase